MENLRIVLGEESQELQYLGISQFGYYLNRIPLGILDKHHHDSFYEICYLESGMQPYYVYTQENPKGEQIELYRLYGGDVFITKPYEYHSTGSFHQLRGSLYWITFDSNAPTLLNHTKKQSDVLKEVLSGIDHHVLHISKSISSRCTEAFALLQERDRLSVFRACELLSLFILELGECNKSIVDEHTRGILLSGKGLRAIDFIQKNVFSPNLDVQAVADHLHFSKPYAMTTFHNEIGMTIHEYILQCKIEQACELLKTYSIIETAHLLNFSSSQHFSRAFRERTNMTPREYISAKVKCSE